MPEQITPTRSELIKVKGRIKLSQMGHKLLKMKRDGLMYELFAVLPKVKDIRANLVKDYQNCLRKLAVAQAFEGQIEIKSVAYSRRSPPTVKVGKKNIMGVVVPRVEADQVRRPLLERGYGVLGTSSLVDELVDAYELLTDQIVKAAELETTLKRLLDEVEKTKRRVNALEFKVIPELNDIKSFITLRLEEIERENIFRLKRVKAKNEENAAAADAQAKAAQTRNGPGERERELEARV
ncbi:MAG TPA: V-type ATP synthase subunit D [Candidatus Thermoplasmatota archaeon]